MTGTGVCSLTCATTLSTAIGARIVPGPSPSLCRQTRIAQLVTDLDPKLAATALGMQDSGLVRYLAGNVDSDRLERTPGIGRQPTRALQVLPCTP